MKSKFTSLLIITLSVMMTTAAFAGTPKKNKNSNLYKGFVITSEGDSLFGTIHYVNPVYNELKVKFINENGRKKTFKTRDVVEYGFLMSKYNKESKTKEEKWVNYQRKRVNTSPIEGSVKFQELFLQRVTTGNITLYNYYKLSTSKVNNREYVKEYFVEQMTPEGFNLTHIHKSNYREQFEGMLAESNVRSYGYMSFHMAVKDFNGNK